jgi:hypothetical protein
LSNALRVFPLELDLYLQGLVAELLCFDQVSLLLIGASNVIVNVSCVEVVLAIDVVENVLGFLIVVEGFVFLLLVVQVGDVEVCLSSLSVILSEDGLAYLQSLMEVLLCLLILFQLDEDASLLLQTVQQVWVPLIARLQPNSPNDFRRNTGSLLNRGRTVIHET